MDEEVLDMIQSKLQNISTILESTIDILNVDTMASPITGKSIAVDFDDTDLTNIQVAVDDAAQQLQDLSAELSTFLMG